jgi:3-deoxy-D-manno-octulosonic-acid transferase
MSLSQWVFTSLRGFYYQMLFWVYNIIITATFFFAGPFIALFFLIRGDRDGFMRERFGLLSRDRVPPKGTRLRIWVHAVSVGEVKVAKVIVREIRKRDERCSIVLSTTTKSGRQTALKEMPDDTVIIYNPIDLIWCVRRSLRTVSPDIFIDLETEIWPNLLWACARFKIPAFLVNGRISVRSINNYRRLRFLMKEALSSFTLLSMISAADAGRIIAIGADPKRVVVGGNAKYDLLLEEARPELSKKIAEVYGIDKKEPVFIAGSTREGEEEIIAEAYLDLLRRYPAMVLIIVPRHIERCAHIESILRSYDINYGLRSTFERDIKKRSASNVILVDTHGELFGLYSLGTIIFCGASLVPLGGQNVLEAAVWGKPVIYGPSMEDFLEAKALLEAVGAGFEVRDKEGLVNTATWLLENADEAERLGRFARSEIGRSSGTGGKQLELIFRVLEGKMRAE